MTTSAGANLPPMDDETKQRMQESAKKHEAKILEGLSAMRQATLRMPDVSDVFAKVAEARETKTETVVALSMVGGGASNATPETRDSFIRELDELLALVDGNGWLGLKDLEARKQIDRLAKYAKQLGYDYPPVSLRLVTFHSKGDFPVSSETELVSVYSPYAGEVCKGYVPAADGCISKPYPEGGSERLPGHTVLCDTLKSWRADIETVSIDPPLKSHMNDPRTTQSADNEVEEITAAQMSSDYGILPGTISKATGKTPGAPGFLPSRKKGRHRLIPRNHAARFAQDFDARREAKTLKQLSG